MPKFSVKKPFVVLVGVVMLLVLGFVSFTKMTTDFMPNMNMPYMIVITTYPGASPEKVESEVSEVVENSVGTVNGVKKVTSTSSENSSIVSLQFEDDTDMDAAMVKVSSAVNQVELPENAGKPMIMQISMDMMMFLRLFVKRIDLYTTHLKALIRLFVLFRLQPYIQANEALLPDKILLVNGSTHPAW